MSSKYSLTGLRNLLFGVVFSILLTGCATQQFRTDVFQDFYSVGWGPTAMTWNGRDLLIGDNTLIMELISLETGSFFYEGFPYNSNGYFSYSRQPQSIRSVGKISGLAWEGDCCENGFLWVADAKNKQIVKLSTTFEPVKVFATNGYTPQGLAFDGRYLWTADVESSRVFQISPETGQLIRQYPSPLKRPLAIAFDCSAMFLLGMDDCKTTSLGCSQKRLVKLDAQNFRVVEEIDLPKQLQRPVSMTVAKNALWIGDRQLNRVFKVSNTGDPIKTQTLYAQTPEADRQKRPKRVAITDKPDITGSTRESDDEAKRSAEEARRSAEEAKRAAEEARRAAEQAKKAFELQQKK